jgi:hypothetical protein
MNQGVKKKFVVMLYDVRTVIRHRWMGRESQGVRDNVRSGTRQNSGRTFGTWPDLRSNTKARSERPLPTVYQKLRSVLKRKLMYTG